MLVVMENDAPIELDSADCLPAKSASRRISLPSEQEVFSNMGRMFGTFEGDKTFRSYACQY